MRIKKTILSGAVIAMFCFLNFGLYGQTMPAVMDTGTFKLQIKYLSEKTNIYNGYRAVRDDIFLKMLKNGSDSLNAAKNEINELKAVIISRENELQEVNKKLQKTEDSLSQAVRNKDSLEFFGIHMTKVLYNTILWGIILGLIAVLVIGGLLFKRNRTLTNETKKDLSEIRSEFEEFRKASREKNEQMVINHFNEIKKLKEGIG